MDIAVGAGIVCWTGAWDIGGRGEALADGADTGDGTELSFGKCGAVAEDVSMGSV